MATKIGAAGPLKALQNRNLDGTTREKTFFISLLKIGGTGSSVNVNYMHINVHEYPMIGTSKGPQGASIIRQMVHEFGHAAMGLGKGWPEVVSDVVEPFENPLMRELNSKYHEDYDRTDYVNGPGPTGLLQW